MRLVLGVLFLWAGIAKAAGARVFFLALLDYRLPLPDLAIQLVAIALPWVEILCGAALVIDLWPETVRPVASALCLIFVAMLTQALVRGIHPNCGCFGASGGWFERPDLALLRAVVLLICSVRLNL